MLTVTNSAITANDVQGGGGGVHGYGFGNCHDGQGGAGQGGGLYFSGLLTLTNSTVATNLAFGGNGLSQGVADADVGQGGGLWVASGAAAQVSFSTIANNQATGGYYGGGGTGGGVNNQGQFYARDTVLAGNTVSGTGTNSGPDLAGDLGSLGHNLVSNSQGGSGFDPTDLLNVDPLLGPLQNNGGPTQTMALLPGSPAIDAGDNTGAPRWDQRGPGYPRIVNGIIDIGAFEVQSGGSGPSAPREERGQQPIPPAVVASLTRGPDFTALLSSATLTSTGQAVTPNAIRSMVPSQEAMSDPRTGCAELCLASVHENARGPLTPLWSGLESSTSAESTLVDD
jgi:hypothetical protein